MCEKKFQTNKKKTIFRRLTAVLSIGRNTQKNRLHKKKQKTNIHLTFFYITVTKIITFIICFKFKTKIFPNKNVNIKLNNRKTPM